MLVAVTGTARASTWHVDASAPGGNGTSWAQAFNNLQAALDLAALTGPDEILIAQGTYIPTFQPIPGDLRSRTFKITTPHNELVIRGGYRGGPSDPGYRDPRRLVTVLSGDRFADDQPGFVNTSENVYHVVTFDGGFGGLTDVELNGLRIVGGNANNPAALATEGGGVFVKAATIRLVRCIFRANAAQRGGALAISDRPVPSNVECIDAAFLGDRAQDLGGAFHAFNGPWSA
jgi:hypothetical protein